MGDFILRELIFAILKDWFIELGINSYDFQKVALFEIQFHIFAVFIALHYNQALY